MKCPSCLSSLTQINAAGEPMLRTRGLIFKSHGIVAVCPKCKGQVEMNQATAQALTQRLVVVFNGAR